MSVCRYCGLEWTGVPDSLPSLAQGLGTRSDEFQTHHESTPALVLLKAVCLAAFLEDTLTKCHMLLTALQKALAFTSQPHRDYDEESIKDESMFELAVKVKSQLETDSTGVDEQYYTGMWNPSQQDCLLSALLCYY